jgi:hypothetical protein
MYAIKKEAPHRADLYMIGLVTLRTLDRATLEKLYTQGCEYVEKLDYELPGSNEPVSNAELIEPKKIGKKGGKKNA